MTAPVTREQAIAEAGRIFVIATAERDALPPRLAAEAAYQSGGPSVDELERRIREMRGLDVADAA